VTEDYFLKIKKVREELSELNGELSNWEVYAEEGPSGLLYQIGDVVDLSFGKHITKELFGGMAQEVIARIKVLIAEKEKEFAKL